MSLLRTSFVSGSQVKLLIKISAYHSSLSAIPYFRYLCRMNILKVCLNNICRSDPAEGFFKDKVEAAGLNWQIDSAATPGPNIGTSFPHLDEKVARRCRIATASSNAVVSAPMMSCFHRIYVMNGAC